LALPVGDSAFTNEPAYTVPGALILLMGMAGIIVLQFGWFANALALAVWFFLMRRDTPMPLQSLALAGLMAVLLVNATFWDRQIPDDAGSGLHITQFGFGYYLWFTVMIGSAVALLIRAWLSSRKTSS
jgi:hypothetical protein